MSIPHLTLGVVLMVALMIPGTILTQPAASQAALAPSAVTGSMLLIENAGQWPAAAHFQVWNSPLGAGTTWLADDAIWMVVASERSQVAGSRLQVTSSEPSGGQPVPLQPANLPRADLPPANLAPATLHALKLTFPGSNPDVRIEPFNPLTTTVSYFIGNDPEQWRPAVPVWGGVRYLNLYPGVDLVLDGRDDNWRLEAAPGAAVEQVNMQVEGADLIALDGTTLFLDVTSQRVPIVLPSAPFSYQVVSRSPWDEPETLTVHPSPYPSQARPDDSPADLLYSSFLGGSSADEGLGIAVDAAGNAYMTGDTLSGSFPTTPGVFDPSYNGGFDVFVLRLNASGSALKYATFLGGGGSDLGAALALDSAGRATVTGETSSSDFPATPGAFDPSYNGIADAFVVRLNPNGSALDFATFLGGSDDDSGGALALDAAGRAYVTGWTMSDDFPTVPSAFDTSFGGGVWDAFVVKLNAAGSGLDYGTFLGGYAPDTGQGIAVDRAGNAYVTGITQSADFPTTPGAFDTSFNGVEDDLPDAFVVKLNPAGENLAYATFLGGSASETSSGIAVDQAGNVYVTGSTVSDDFPTTPGAFDSIFSGCWGGDAFVAKLNPTGSDLIYATYLGGSAGAIGTAIAVDEAGSAYVTGYTSSDDFPTTPNAFDPSFNGGLGDDAIVIRLNSAGSALLYATFLGGGHIDYGLAVAVNRAGTTYVTGATRSNDFPTTLDAFDRSYNGGYGDAFVVKLAMSYTPNVLAPIEQPSAGALVTGTVTLSGYAIDLAGASGTGIDSVRVYLDGPSGVGALIGDATYGLDRPDIASQYGARFGPSGWELDWNTRPVTRGAHLLYVSAHRTSDNAWSQLPPHAVNLAMTVPGEGYWADGYDVGMGVYDYIGALAVDNDSYAIYAAGDFSKIGGVNANRIARWDQATASWSPLGSGLGEAYPDDFVTSLALDAAGNLYAGGAFTMAGGISAYHIAKWDGAAWSALGYGVGGGWPGRGVRALAVDNTSHSVYVGGPFTEAGGIIVNHIARWDEATSSWSPLGSGMNGSVNALALDSSGNLYAGGEFTAAGGVSADHIAKWNPATESWSALGNAAGLWAEIRALAVDRDGVVYAGGSYLPAGNVGVPAVLKWDGTTWSLLGSSFEDGYVDTLALDGAGILYAAGQDQFRVISVTRWDPETGSWLTIGNSEAGYPAYPMIRALTLDGANNLYAAGRFTTIGAVAAQSVALWDPLTSSWSSLGSGGAGNGMDSYVYALALDEANAALYAGGSFFTAGDVVANGIARWDQATLSWSPLGSGMGGVDYANVSALALSHDGKLYVGGGFTTAGGGRASYIARWDPATSSWWHLGSGMNGPVYALALDDAGNLYAGGNFTTAGGVSANKIARWDGAAWSALGSGLTGYYPFVSALAVDSAGNVYAGGTFYYAGGVEANSIARWDRATASWSALGSGVGGLQPPPWPNYYVAVNALAVDDVRGTVYAGGDFLTAGGVRANAVAQWNPATSTWSDLGGSMNGANEPAVHALALDSAGNLYVAGGWFDVVGGVGANGFARWNPATESWTILRSDGGILALALDEVGPSVYAGGVFTTAGGKDSRYIGQWQPGQKRYLPLVARGWSNHRRYLPMIIRR